MVPALTEFPRNANETKDTPFRKSAKVSSNAVQAGATKDAVLVSAEVAESGPTLAYLAADQITTRKSASVE